MGSICCGFLLQQIVHFIHKLLNYFGHILLLLLLLLLLPESPLSQKRYFLSTVVVLLISTLASFVIVHTYTK